MVVRRPIARPVSRVDVIGEPAFSAPSRPALDSDAYAAWLDDAWTGLGTEQAGIVGTSLGGWLALDFAIRRPRRVTSLPLISPAGVGRQRVSTRLRLAWLRLILPFTLLDRLGESD